MKILNSSILLLFVLIVQLGFSQQKPSSAEKPAKVLGAIIGKVVDAQTQVSLEYTNVSVHKLSDSSIVTGGITSRSGEFSLEKIPQGKYYVRINFIGYKNAYVLNVVIDKTHVFKDLGKIKLKQNAEVLDAFEVTTEKEGIEFKIDKKVINVDKFYTATSGTAVDVLENVPSVSVDAERNVSLRGSSGFTVLVDGRPTIMTAADALEQYPSSAIEKIEIITNPSAKYDPEGTAGIINIITKKQKLQGISGIANMNFGMYNNYGGDILLQVKTDKTSWYVGADYNKRRRVGDQETYNATQDSDTIYEIEGLGDYDKGRVSSTFRSGIDLKISNKNFLLIEGSLQASDRLGKNEVDYIESNNKAVTDRYNNLSESSRKSFNWTLNSDYTHKFQGDDKKLGVQVSWSHMDGDEYSLNELFGIDDNQLRTGQRNTEVGPNIKGQTRWNYEHKINDSLKFEAGYQGTYDKSMDDFGTSNYDTLKMEYIDVDSAYRSSSFERMIHAPYALVAGSVRKFGYQFGLRTEFTNRDVSIVGNATNYATNRIDLFPTIHFSYEFPKNHQLMMSYSRRIQRPRPWNLEPYVTARSQFSYRSGNPNLQPEYIDAAEIGYQKIIDKIFISTEVYYRYTHDKEERIQQAYPERGIGATLSIPENVGTDQATGVEMMLKMPLNIWWDINFMVNLYDYRVQGEYTDAFDGTSYSFANQSTNYTLRLNQTFKVFKHTKFQFNGSYNSTTVTAQGTRTGFVDFSAAVRTDVIKNKLSFNLQARNLFRTALHEHISSGPNFETRNTSNMVGPVVTFSATYKLNNYRAKKGSSKPGGDEM
jgi:outer membrane receptor protein involved in Fe transport